MGYTQKTRMSEDERKLVLEHLKAIVRDRLGFEGIEDEQMNENCFYWGLVTSSTGFAHNMNLEFEDRFGNVFYSSALELFRTLILQRVMGATLDLEDRRLLVYEFSAYAYERMHRRFITKAKMTRTS